MAHHTRNATSWRKGQSGNPAGRRPMSAELTDVVVLCRRLTPEIVQILFRHAQSDNAPVSLRASIWLLERGWGRAPQPLEFQQTPGLMPKSFRSDLEDALQQGRERVLSDRWNSRLAEECARRDFEARLDAEVAAEEAREEDSEPEEEPEADDDLDDDPAEGEQDGSPEAPEPGDSATPEALRGSTRPPVAAERLQDSRYPPVPPQRLQDGEDAMPARERLAIEPPRPARSVEPDPMPGLVLSPAERAEHAARALNQVMPERGWPIREAEAWLRARYPDLSGDWRVPSTLTRI
jgi:hypothetical protein